MQLNAIIVFPCGPAKTVPIYGITVPTEQFTSVPKERVFL